MRNSPPADRIHAAAARSDRPPKFTLLSDGRVCDRVFDLLVARYTPLVRAIVSRKLRRPEAVEDVCQETFLRVFRYAAAFDEVDEQDLWVKEVARNLCVDHLRRERLASRRAGAFELWYARLEAVRANAEQAERDRADARDALRLLPKTYRDVLARALDGEPPGRAARALGISEAAYRGRLNDALRVFADRVG